MKRIILITCIILLASWVVFLTGEGFGFFSGRQRELLLRQVVSIKNIPPGAGEIRIWMPFPAQTPYQKIEYANSKGAYTSKLSSDKVYGNKMSYYVLSSPEAPVVHIERVYKISRAEFKNKPVGLVKGRSPWHREERLELRKYTGEDNFLIVTDEVKQLAAKITQGKTTDIEKARSIYDYVFENVSYDKSEPGWGAGDIKRICLIKKGNCTDFHSLFIVLCRACGIPSRFIIGVPLSDRHFAEVRNYHCWAEFYASGYGWVPVDISEAWKSKTKYEYFFGAVDENRIEFSEGRDIVLEPPQHGGPLNYFVFPYVEIDGEPFDNVEASFIYEDVKKEG